MKLWLLITPPPVSEDTAYLIGRVASRCESVQMQVVDEDAQKLPSPPDDINGILNRSFSTSEAFLSALDRLGAILGIPVINPGAATLRACDKRGYPNHFSHLTPDSWTVESLHDLYALQTRERRELVLKAPFGKRGEGVIRFRGKADHAAAAALFDEAPPGGLAVQVFCPDFVAGDKRVIVQRADGGYEIAAWFKRVPKPGGWKSNLHAGGSIVPCDLEEDEKALSMEVAEIAGLDYLGIDLARQDNRPLLIETNAYTGGHIDFDTDRHQHSADGFARMIVSLMENGRP